ncbi:MAG: hypothetical protein K6G22_06580 [Lachnospiraceae bacterium]|nr:hypothetical protein [Lachnospiraceae bacterium]
MDNKSTIRIMIATVCLIIAGLAIYGAYYFVTYRSEANKMAVLINEGNEKMDAQDYAGAIENYEMAMEIDPEEEEIKDAISHAYVLMGGTYGTTDDAIGSYENAIIYNPENKSAYWGISNIYEDRENEDMVLETLLRGYAATGDENMKIKTDNIEAERARILAEEEEAAKEAAEKAAIEEAHNDLLEKLIPVFAAGNKDDIKTVLRTDEYQELSDEAVGKGISFYYGDKDESGKKNGTGLGVYQDGYYYYGGYVNDVRSGDGLWIRAVYPEGSALGSFIYEGKWENDAPNGEGTCTSNYYADRVGSGGMTKQIITGSYKDGLENGKMALSGSLKSGGTVKYSYTSADGVAAKISDEDSGVKGQYIIAKSSDESSNLTSDGSKRGVEGFAD